jgi:translation initiation factor IF-3
MPDNNSSRYRINEAIRAKEVRVLSEDGQPLGIMPVRDALKLANEKEIDLVEIAPQAVPPVCKIIDFGKFLYEQQKREKAQKKTQQQQQMKEVRFKWRTDTHDFNFKLRHAREFILEGNKVKASVMFRGREIVHKEIGQELLLKFVAGIEDIAKVDQPMKSEGKLLAVVLSPDKVKKKGDDEKKEKPAKADKEKEKSKV